MRAAQLDVEGREVPATKAGPLAPPPAPAPKKTSTPPAPEPCPGQIPVPLPREVLLCSDDCVTPPLLLW